MGFKENLTNLRNNAEPKLSQEDIARVLSMTRPTYKQLETGERVPSNTELQAISELFGVRIENLLDHNITTEVAAPKDATNVNEAKYRNLILYLAEHIGARPNVGETVFYKLIYFIETLALKNLNRAIAGEQFYKRQYGPVPVSFTSLTNKMIATNQLDRVRGYYYTYMQTKYLPRVESTGFTNEEKEVIDRVIAFLGNKSATELSDLSHEDAPWIQAKDGDIVDLGLIENTPQVKATLMARW